MSEKQENKLNETTNQVNTKVVKQPNPTNANQIQSKSSTKQQNQSSNRQTNSNHNQIQKTKPENKVNESTYQNYPKS